MTNSSKGPVLIDLETSPPAQPENAPAVPDVILGNDQGAALQKVATIAARKPSRLARWFWMIFTALAGFIVSLAAWDYVNALLVRSPVLGAIATVLLIVLCLLLSMIALRELAAFSRLKRLDTIQNAAADALTAKDVTAARGAVGQVQKLYAHRPDAQWGLARYQEQAADQMDADAVIGLSEMTILAPLDKAAQREVEAAARQVATVTALVPLALADVFTALTANLRMIRRIAEIYGGRSGVIGSWRLTRSVLTHLVATGAVAVGDDLIGSIAGGGVLSKVSRRFGEGVINGALTARVGVAAIDVCRPLPFTNTKRPSVTGLVKRALTGLFGQT